MSYDKKITHNSDRHSTRRAHDDDGEAKRGHRYRPGKLGGSHHRCIDDDSMVLGSRLGGRRLHR